MSKVSLLAATLFVVLPVQAATPVAPFKSPERIRIPDNIPVITPGWYTRADWYRHPSHRRATSRSDEYIGIPRRRGDIVSFYLIKRHLFAETTKQNRHTKGAEKLFLPSYTVRIRRYNCANDTYSSESPLWITEAWGASPEAKGGFMSPVNSWEDKWRVTPGQTRVEIEGRPYWAMEPKRDPRYKQKPLDWIPIRPGSYGADHIDYACTKLL